MHEVYKPMIQPLICFWRRAAGQVERFNTFSSAFAEFVFHMSCSVSKLGRIGREKLPEVVQQHV